MTTNTSQWKHICPEKMCLFLPQPEQWKANDFWASSECFQLFKWREYQCSPLGSGSINFAHERSSLKPKFLCCLRVLHTQHIGDDCSEQQLSGILDIKVKLVFGSPPVKSSSQISPETTVASHAIPHFWREIQKNPFKQDKSTSRDFIAPLTTSRPFNT